MLKNVEIAVAELGLDCQVEHVNRISAMLEAGITGTPALAIDGRVEVMGRALDVASVKQILQPASGAR
jgi:hypothetical protein